VDAAWLVAFRILFGLTLGVSMVRFLIYGWVDRFFVEPQFHFKYWGFAWVEPLSGPAMHALFGLLAALAFALAAGALFRTSALLFALGLTYFQLIDVTTYLNHYYLAALLAWLLALSPAAKSYSVDAWLARRFGAKSEPKRQQVPAFWLYLLRFQVGTVYVFAGLAKAQPDWLLHAQPLSIWLGTSSSLPVLGALLRLPYAPLFMSWCGFLFDSSVVVWLLWRRTRPYAYLAVIVFHTLTRVLFPIGMFPVIMTLAALVFFDPNWPRALAARVLNRPLTGPVLEPSPSPVGRWQLLALGLAALYCGLQLAVPVRSLAYGGNVLWHEQGMRFSWRVMVRAKGGRTTFVLKNRLNGRTWYVSPDAYLTGLQESEMSSQPDLILQLAHHIQRDVEQRGLGPVEVYVDSRVSLNGRRSQPFIDPHVDLARIHDGVAPKLWVLPTPTDSPPHLKVVL
jgi:vitamin K-dependent gamma-carboxylase